MICTSTLGCIVHRGARHADTCPSKDRRSGPSGQHTQPRKKVDSTRLEALRKLLPELALQPDATGNEVLDAAIRHLSS